MFSIGDKVLVYERTSIDSELFTIKGEAQITNITSRTLKLKFKFLGIIPYQRWLPMNDFFFYEIIT